MLQILLRLTISIPSPLYPLVGSAWHAGRRLQVGTVQTSRCRVCVCLEVTSHVPVLRGGAGEGFVTRSLFGIRGTFWGVGLFLELPEEINIEGLPIVLLLVLVIHPLRLKVLTVRDARVRYIITLDRPSFLPDRAQLR